MIVGKPFRFGLVGVLPIRQGTYYPLSLKVSSGIQDIFRIFLPCADGCIVGRTLTYFTYGRGNQGETPTS